MSDFQLKPKTYEVLMVQQFKFQIVLQDPKFISYIKNH